MAEQELWTEKTAEVKARAVGFISHVTVAVSGGHRYQVSTGGS